MICHKIFDFICKRKYIAGICFILSLAISEPIRLQWTMAEIPIYWTARLFVICFPALMDLPTFILLPPAVFFFIISIIPLWERKFNWPAFVLVLIGFLFFPLTYFSTIEYGYLLWILVILFIGLNLWLRSVGYFYSTAIAAVVWDLLAAVLAFADGAPYTGVPYAFQPGLPPLMIMMIDFILIAIFSLMWGFRVNLAKRWHLFETYA